MADNTVTPATPEAIEAEIERDRMALRGTLEELQDELSWDGMARRVSAQVRDHGADWAQGAADAARANPIALGLTSVGLLWLMFGRGPQLSHHDHTAYRVRTRSYSDTADRHNDDDDDGRDARRLTSQGSRVSADWQTRRPRQDDHHSRELGDDWLGRRDKLHQNDTEEGMADRIKHAARSMGERLREGTEDFSEEARQRVMDARYRALRARDSAQRQMERGARGVFRGFESEPLLFGVLAFAVGAGVAAMLPRTQRENELMGDYSDRLYDEAESIYEEEKSRIRSAVQAGMDEAKSAVSDIRDAAEEKLTDRGNSSAGQSSGQSAGHSSASASSASTSPGTTTTAATGNAGSSGAGSPGTRT